MSTDRSSRKRQCIYKEVRDKQKQLNVISLTVGQICSAESSETPSGDGLKCSFPGCRSKRTFNRKYELNRHAKIHTPQQKFDCPAINCKYVGTKAFYRVDKFRDHMDSAHNQDTLYLCTQDGCSLALVPMKLLILVAHIGKHIVSWRSLLWHCREALLRHCYCRCPVKGCSKLFSHSYLLRAHILEHDEGDRQASSVELAARGFDFADGSLICPVSDCQIRVPTLIEFEMHFIDHLFSDPDHYRTWMIDAFGNVPFCKQWGKKIPFQPGTLGAVTCSSCNKTIDQADVSSHHLQLLKDPEELRGCREQVLRMYPDFDSHPVFDDLKPISRPGTDGLRE